MRKNAPAAVALVTMLSGCGTAITVIPLKSQKGLLARSPESVELFTAGRPCRPFVEVAMLEAQQAGWSLDDQAAILQKLRARAAELGCDGLVITGQNNRVGGFPNSGVSTALGFQATCIVFEPGP